MDDRFNTIAGWVLFAGIIALGASTLSYKYFKGERPEQLGYVIEGVVAEGADAAVEMTLPEAINMMSVDEQIAAGARVFNKCSSCHTVEQGGANGIGPNLYAVMGAGIGNHVPGYAYSDALVGVGGTWDWNTMNDWLKNPRAFADGTKMSFAGLPKIEDRAAVAMYMNSLGSDLPVPEYVEVLAEDGGEGDGPAGDLAAEDTAEGIAAAE